MLPSSVIGDSYLQSKPIVVAYTTSAPSSPISDDNKLAVGSYYFVSDTNVWVRLGNANTDVATIPTAPQGTTHARQLYCPAGVPMPVGIPAGTSAAVGVWISARAPTTSSAGNLQITGPISVSALP